MSYAQAPASHPRTRITTDARVELQDHPLSHIPGTTMDRRGGITIDLPAPTSIGEGWKQGALLGLHLLDAVRACDGVNHRMSLLKILPAVFAHTDTDRAAFDRMQGFVRVLEMVTEGYLQHRDHRQDAPFVIGLEQAWRELEGVVVS